MRLPVERLLGGAVGAGDQHLAAALAVAGGVDDDPLALAHAAEGGLVAEQLQRVDRLAALADQQAVVVLAVDDGVDPVVVLADLDLTFKVKLVENPLDQLPHPLGRLRRPIPVPSLMTLILSAGEPLAVERGIRSGRSQSSGSVPRPDARERPQAARPATGAGPLTPTAASSFSAAAAGRFRRRGLLRRRHLRAAGSTCLITYCWPIVQMLVVIQ